MAAQRFDKSSHLGTARELRKMSREGIGTVSEALTSLCVVDNSRKRRELKISDTIQRVP